MNNIERTMQLMQNGMTCSKALAEVYNIRKINILFKNDDFNIPVSKLRFSNRVNNCLGRTHLTTLLEVVDYIAEKGWNSIKNFGKGSAQEVYDKFIDVAWEHLGTKERAKFLLRVDAENEVKL